MWKPNGHIIQYVYHPDQQSTFGDEFSWTLNGDPIQIIPGTWYYVETHIVMNTLGQTDGQLTSWLNGQQVLNIDGMRFRSRQDVAIDVDYFSTFFGVALTHGPPLKMNIFILTILLFPLIP